MAYVIIKSVVGDYSMFLIFAEGTTQEGLHKVSNSVRGTTRCFGILRKFDGTYTVSLY